MKRALWTVVLGLCGFLLGGKGGEWWGAIVGMVWMGSIGFGFGSIFTETRPSKLLIVYWGATLALVGVFFGLLVGALLLPNDSTFNEVIHGVLGFVAGVGLGVLIGTGQLGKRRRQSRALQ